MSALEIPATSTTPATAFNNENGELHMSGRSLENNADLFFKPLISWVDEYITQPHLHTTLHLNMEYSNTPSVRCLFSILRKLKYLEESGKSLTVKWEYNAEDEDMLANGRIYSEMLKLPFEFIEGV